MLQPNSRPHRQGRTKRARGLRNGASVSEKWTWSFLRNDNLGCRFRRQYPIGDYTLDFYCPQHKLCIEVDGEQHFDSLEEDKERDAYLSGLGIRVIRIPSLDLFDDENLAMSAWLKIIREALDG
ncbi:MAG TPA: endonuclease domain-containing protein [Fimbriimonadaceae bacterium]